MPLQNSKSQVPPNLGADVPPKCPQRQAPPSGTFHDFRRSRGHRGQHFPETLSYARARKQLSGIICPICPLTKKKRSGSPIKRASTAWGLFFPHVPPAYIWTNLHRGQGQGGDQ